VSTKTTIAVRDLEGISLVSGASRPVFTGTIASACESIGLDNFIEMTRLARTNDPRAARFMDAWDALDASEQQARGAADVVCARLGLVPIELLRVVAEAVYSFSMSVAQMKATLALPSIVARSVEVALTDKGVADRRMLFQHAGFLPTPKGSQVATAVTQNAQPNEQGVVPAQRPETTIRRLTNRFNESRGLTPPPWAAQRERIPGEEDDGG
jgi:hypothetical protein